mmetsp:Transcript_53137/g.141337  ORF Transcript_53137/g.141337 Transcript_53137/m.141337 type:complete len:187 (-) Transcript_53137:162-722(-)
MAFYLNVELTNKEQVHKAQAKGFYGNFMRIGSFVGGIAAAVTDESALGQNAAESAAARVRHKLDGKAAVAIKFVRDLRFGIRVSGYMGDSERPPDDLVTVLSVAFCTSCSDGMSAFPHSGVDTQLVAVAQDLTQDLHQFFEVQGIASRVHFTMSEEDELFFSKKVEIPCAEPSAASGRPDQMLEVS